MGRGDKPMILQVIFDDKFGDYAIEQFRPYEDKVRFVLVKNISDNIKLVKKIQEKDIISFGTPAYKQLIDQLGDYKAVVMHGLFSYIQYDIVNHMPEQVKLAWVLWGTEIYSRKDTIWSHLAPITKFMFQLKQCKDAIAGQHRTATDVPIRILRRVDYTLGSSLELYEDAKNYIGNPNMKHLMYSYFTLEHLIGEDLLDKTVNGNNILLGNSSTPDNNHLDILLRLKRIGIQGERILITPLSYGDLWIKHIVNNVGKLLFGKQFYPLLDYMPRSTYNQVVQSCSVFVANHHRPNAFGNTLTALWLGARVYVSNKNVQTKFLQRLGLNINIIEDDLNKRNRLLFAPLSDSEREENQEIIRNVYGINQMQKNIRNIVHILENE